MSETTNLNIKIDRELKIKADRLFNEMGNKTVTKKLYKAMQMCIKV